MADAVAPAVDKVGPPAPSAPESTAQAPASSGLPSAAPTSEPTSAPTGPAIPGLTATAPAPADASVSVPPPAADPAPEKSAEPAVEEKKLEHGSGGAGPAVSAPKPVEVMSVPDTPMNGSTPAGGTPRPELDIPTEKVQIPKSDDAPASGAQQTSAPAVTTGVQEPAPTPAAPLPKEDSIPEPIKDSPNGPTLNGKAAGQPAEMAGAIQTNESAPAQPATLKRKLEEDQPDEKVNGSTAPKAEPEHVEKKTKLSEPDSVPAVNNSNKNPEDSTTATTESASTNDTGKTNGRAKRGMGKRAKKIAEAVVGKTARKTRSQGPA